MKKQGAKGLQKSLKLLVKSSFIVFIGVVLSKLFTYVYKIVIARGFGPEAYGLFSLAVMVSGIFIAFASFGLVEGVTRYIPYYKGKRQYDRARYIFRFTFIFISVLSILFGILLFFLSEYISVRIFHNSNLIIYLKTFGFLVPISVLSSFYLASIRAAEKIGLYSFIINIFQSGAKLALLGLLILIGIRESAVPFSYLGGTLLMLFAAYISSKYYVRELFKKSGANENERRESVREVFSYSWPLMFLSLITVLFGWIDSFVIGYVMNASDVGFYNAAFTIVAFLGIAPDLFMQLFFPLIVREYAKKKIKLIEEISKQVAKWIYIMNLPLFIILFLFPGAMINIFFGKEYLVAESALRILSIGGVLSSLLTLQSNILSMAGKSKLILSNLIIASLVNLILNILLVPKYGLIGAASATAFVWMVLSLVVFIQVKVYTTIIPLRRKMAKITIISLIAAALLLLVKQFVPLSIINVIILGILFGMVYLFIIFITGCLDRNDLMILRTIKAKFVTAKK